VVDSWRERTTWTCTYVRLLEQPLSLPAAALIECTCTVDASTHCPAYSVAVRVKKDREAPWEHVTEYSWDGDG
jgi:hypothetical protein